MTVQVNRKIDVQGFIMNSLLEEVNSIKLELERLEETKNKQKNEITNLRASIEAIEEQLYITEDNIKNSKENKANLMNKAEEIKKNRTL